MNGNPILRPRKKYTKSFPIITKIIGSLQLTKQRIKDEQIILINQNMYSISKQAVITGSTIYMVQRWWLRGYPLSRQPPSIGR